MPCVCTIKVLFQVNEREHRALLLFCIDDTASAHPRETGSLCCLTLFLLSFFFFREWPSSGGIPVSLLGLMAVASSRLLSNIIFLKMSFFRKRPVNPTNSRHSSAFNDGVVSTASSFKGGLG